MNTNGINKEAVNTVVEGDVPQKIRNEICRCEKNGDVDIRELKFRVNNFLWNELPMKTTLHRAEILSCRIFELVQAEKEKVRC